MRLGLLWLLAAISTAASGGPVAPLNWSQDGRWVVYTTAATERPPVFDPGWIFTGTPPDLKSRTLVGAVSADLPCRYRIYAADAESGASVLLEESRDPLTSPAWSPDGKALAFCRVVDVAPEKLRFETVVQDAPGHDRILASQLFEGKIADRPNWTTLVPAWSPDGRYLAVPDPATASGLAVVRVDNGQVVKTIEGMSPSWSPDGSKLAFIRPGRPASLLGVEVGYARADKTASVPAVEVSLGPPRHLVDLGQPTQSPVWSRDGKSVMAVARRVVVAGSGPKLQVNLLRVRFESGLVETVAHLTVDPVEPEKSFRGVCLGHDHDLDDLFFSLDVENQPATIVWSHPKHQETVDRFNPLNVLTRVSALSLSPNAKTLAIRFGERDDCHTTALYDLGTRRLTLLASDEPSRLEWTALLITTAERLLKVSLPKATAGGQALARPTLFPVPGELNANHEIVVDLRRIGRLGRLLYEPSRSLREGDPSLGRYLNEARLFFDTLREDYPAALSSLEAMESETTAPDQLGRLMALRAQLFLGSGDVERASDTIGFLGAIEDVSVSRFEESPAGSTLTPEPAASRGWARYLTARLDDLVKAKSGKAGTAEEPVFAPNMPAPPMPPPLQGVPFELLPNGAFVVPRNGPIARPFVPGPFVDAPPRVQIRVNRPRAARAPLPDLPPAPFRRR